VKRAWSVGHIDRVPIASMRRPRKKRSDPCQQYRAAQRECM
jgi:hypothetical protein